MSDKITNFQLTSEDIIRNVKTTNRFLDPDYKPYKNPIIKSNDLRQLKV